MSLKNHADRNAYMAEYMTRRYHRRRAAAVERLGATCIDCGAKEALELDHADRRTKTFTIAKILSTGSDAKVQAELAKCVLRCRTCHQQKSLAERGLTSAKGTHGSLSALKYCKPRCEACRTFWRQYQREYKARKAGSLLDPVG